LADEQPTEPKLAEDLKTSPAADQLSLDHLMAFVTGIGLFL